MKSQPVRPGQLVRHQAQLAVGRNAIDRMRQLGRRLVAFPVTADAERGSVNQIEPSDLQTMSFGELSGLPLNLSASTVILPLYSVRVTRRVRCSQVSRRPYGDHGTCRWKSSTVAARR